MYFTPGSFKSNSEYTELVREINHAYKLGVYPCVDNLLRKLFKGLIIDIFRYRYCRDRSKIPLFFVLEEGQYQSFDVLLDNFNKMLDDIDPKNASMYRRFISRLHHWKHEFDTDEVQIKKKLDNSRNEFESGAKCLSTLLNNVTAA